MRLIAPVLSLTLSVATPAFAQMGYGGGFGGSPMSSPQMPARRDDLSTAVRDLKEGKIADAIPYLERAHNEQPHSADIMNLLGSTYRLLGNYPMAVAWYKNALVEDPDHKHARANLGELYLEVNDVSSAQSQLAELGRICPDGCDDRNALSKAIATYQTAHPAVPALSATAAPATGAVAKPSN